MLIEIDWGRRIGNYEIGIDDQGSQLQIIIHRHR